MFSDVPGIVGTVVGVIALGVSFWNLWLWYQGRQPLLLVEPKNAVMPDLDGPQMVVTVRNRRPYVTQLTGICMQIPDSQDGERMFFPGIAGEARIPCAIQPFHCIRLWIPLREIAAELKCREKSGSVEVVFEAETGSGHTFTGIGSLLVDAWA